MNYLIPANTKNGKLILGIFKPSDLILFSVGVLITILLLVIMPQDDVKVTVLSLTPAVVCAFLVMPVPNYHNMLTIIIELYEFVTTRQTYRWRGWCYKVGKKSK